MTAAIEHKTYVATRCVECHHEALRICIIHDGCQFNYHDARECGQRQNDVDQRRERIANDLAWLQERGFACTEGDAISN